MSSPEIAYKRKNYSFEQKVSALKLLRENGYNYSRTARELSLVYKTIQRWEKRIGAAVFELLDLYEGNIDKVTRDEVKKRLDSISNSKVQEESSNHSFYLLAQKVKMIALKRLVKLLPDETDVSKITSALKLLHKIVQDDSQVNEDNETEVPDYIKSIMERYRQ